MSQIISQKYNSIDYLKVCMAILVVAIHTSAYNCYELSWVNMIGETLVSVAVPFFFVASGFLLWQKVVGATTLVKRERVKNWIFKVVRLYLVWTLIFMPYTIYGFVKDGISLEKSIVVFLRNVLLVGENYWSWPLWYLLAMIVAGCILYLLLRVRCPQRGIYSVAIGLAVMGVVLNFIHEQAMGANYLDVYFSLFKTTRNGFFVGFPYIVVGVAIAEHGVIKSRTVLWMMLVLALVLQMQGLPLVLFFLVYALFSLVLHWELPNDRSERYYNARLSSTVIYFVHMLWVGALTLLLPQSIAPYWMFVIVVALSFATAYVVIRNKNSALVKICFR